MNARPNRTAVNRLVTNAALDRTGTTPERKVEAMATAKPSDTVIKRKLAAARQGSRDGARSVLRALRLALARAAADEAGLPLAVIGATQGRCARWKTSARCCPGTGCTCFWTVPTAGPAG